MTALYSPRPYWRPGLSILRGAPMWRWAGWAAIVIGVTLFVPAAVFIVSIVDYVWFWPWPFYYTPAGTGRELVAGSTPPAVATELPASS